MTSIRGKGLLNAIVVDDEEEGSLAMDVCLALKVSLANKNSS